MKRVKELINKTNVQCDIEFEFTGFSNQHEKFYEIKPASIMFSKIIESSEIKKYLQEIDNLTIISG
jgi:hypothetical protein